MKRLLLLASFCCVFYFYASAQSTCTQTLRTARSTYDQGRLHELPALLEGCINNGFTQQEKVEAYKLLTLAYIYLEEPTKADEAMLNLLNTDHYFKPNNATDPAEFIALYKTFRTEPIYRLGGKTGANASQPNVVESVAANEGTSKYKYGVSFQFYVTAELPINEKITIDAGLGYLQRAFGYTNSVAFTDTTFTTTAKEKQNWLSLPISIQYQFNKIKFRPYVSVGAQVDYLLGASMSSLRSRKGYQSIDDKSFDMSPQREKLNISAIAAIGSHFPLSGGYVVAEIRFAYGITKLNSTATGFGIDSNLPFQYGYGDSIFKINTVTASIGYVYNIFNPKKLRKRK